ncbi:MAG TPA: TolC family protein [Vicinamibacterales bacterium]|nr:TolC family protein [Vicinamibacterales bacterium]
MRSAILGGACVVALAAAPAFAQRDEPLQLAALQRQALEADARAKEIELLGAQTDLRARNLEAERYPAVSVLGQAQLQSDVPTPPPFLPGGQPLFVPPKDTYDVSVRVDQRIYDPGSSARLALAHADLAESQARVRSSLHALRTEVNESFFAAALLQEELGALQTSIDDLEARLRETTARVREGAALAGEAAAVEAALLRQRQQADELRANRGAALARLSMLTSRPIGDDAVTSLPELTAAVSTARGALGTLRSRPEYAQFDRTRDRVARQEDAAAAADLPQVSAFGRAGYGRPGLNFINDQWQVYALGGVQMQWKAWTWKSSTHEREALALQKDIVDAEERAFRSSIRRGIEADLAAIDRLQGTVAADERIITLRESIDRAARLRLQEGVTTAADYLDRRSEWLTAQFDRARHRVELAHAQASLLTTLGLEVQ